MARIESSCRIARSSTPTWMNIGKNSVCAYVHSTWRLQQMCRLACQPDMLASVMATTFIACSISGACWASSAILYPDHTMDSRVWTTQVTLCPEDWGSSQEPFVLGTKYWVYMIWTRLDNGNIIPKKRLVEYPLYGFGHKTLILFLAMSTVLTISICKYARRKSEWTWRPKSGSVYFLFAGQSSRSEGPLREFGHVPKGGRGGATQQYKVCKWLWHWWNSYYFK